MAKHSCHLVCAVAFALYWWIVPETQVHEGLRPILMVSAPLGLSLRRRML